MLTPLSRPEALIAHWRGRAAIESRHVAGRVYERCAAELAEIIVKQAMAASLPHAEAPPTPCCHSRFYTGCLSCALRERETLGEMVALLRQVYGNTDNLYDLRKRARTEHPASALRLLAADLHAELEKWSDSEVFYAMDKIKAIASRLDTLATERTS